MGGNELLAVELVKQLLVELIQCRPKPDAKVIPAGA